MYALFLFTLARAWYVILLLRFFLDDMAPLKWASFDFNLEKIEVFGKEL